MDANVQILQKIIKNQAIKLVILWSLITYSYLSSLIYKDFIDMIKKE